MSKRVKLEGNFATSTTDVEESLLSEDKNHLQYTKFRLVEHFDPDDGIGEYRIPRHNVKIRTSSEIVRYTRSP